MGNTYDVHVNKLFLLQKKAIRIVNKKPFLYHTNNLFFTNKILKFPDIFKLKIASHIYKNKLFNSWTSQHNINTRHQNDLVPNFQRLRVCQNSISYLGPKIWNDIPMEIKSASSLHSFKSRFKNYLISLYDPDLRN